MPSPITMAYNTRGLVLLGLLLFFAFQPAYARSVIRADVEAAAAGRERSSLNAGWKFSRFTSNPDQLSYDSMKSWILPSANDYIGGNKRQRPSGTPPGSSVQYVQATFNDASWESLDLPHDWAIKGPFNAPGISGGMGRLPSNGVGWYRRKVSFTADDLSKRLYLDIDGAYSYAAVWLNGVLVGGWPYGYNSFRLDLTPYAKSGENQLAIRLDNAADSSRWYPGGGIYRNVWLVKVNPVHVAHYGTHVTTPTVSAQSATINIAVQVENSGNATQDVDVVTAVYAYDPIAKTATGSAVATFPKGTVSVKVGQKQSVNSTVTLANPQLWGPPPKQKPNQYVAVTTVSPKGASGAIDTYETPFGIRSVVFDPNKGVIVNGQAMRLQGTCNHHDLGSLGAAYNVRAGERQQEMLQEMGSNALRTSHNPPAPEFLDTADRLGMLVLDEIFDCWNTAKVGHDFHLIFADWHEPDLRNFVRRDRNHPSVIAWSVGNEIPEQGNAQGTSTGTELRNLAKSEDSSRPVTMAMNGAGPNSGVAGVMDLEGLNYQGEGGGTSQNSAFPGFHSKFPNKMVFTTESSSVLSTRGTFLFPVTSGNAAVVGNGNGQGGDSSRRYVSAYDLYGPSWGTSPDKVFQMQDKYPYAGGEFVWTGWDYIGEPTPYDQSRSSYFGIIDMAGFKKDRFYLYQARWRPDLPMAHILPHWNWPDRVGQVTPIHVYTSGDEAEVFVNGKSQGRKKKNQGEYRLRWDSVTYQAGNISVVAYKNGARWATDSRRTVDSPTKLNVTADRTTIKADGKDLSFVSVAVTDNTGDVAPLAMNSITFSISGPGKIVSTDNGNPTDMTVFSSLTRSAFNGRALAIVRANPGSTGKITVTASANGLTGGSVDIQAN